MCNLMTKKRRIFILLIITALFVFPLFWFSSNSIDIGGDDTHLYFYVPENFVSNLSLYCWNSYNNLSKEYMPWHGFPFIFIPLALKKLGLQVGSSLMLTYGMTLSLAFLSCYLFIKEILSRIKLSDGNRWLSSVIGALVYIFSPIIFIVDWQPRLPEIYGLFLYPLLIYFYMIALRRRKPIFLIFGAMLLSIFAFAMYMAVPWFVAFMLGSVPIIFGLIFFEKRKSLALKYFIGYVMLCILLNSHWIIILIDITFLSKVDFITYGKSMVSGSMGLFFHNVQFMNVYYTFLMLPSKEFYSASIFCDLVPYRYSFMFLMLPLSIIIALIKGDKESRKLLLWFLIPVIMLVYLITANVTDLGSAFFASLLNNVYGFIMFRNFQTKFSIALSFFYAVLIAISLAVILKRSFSKVFKSGFVFLLMLPFLMPAISLLRGDLIGRSPAKSFHEYTCVNLLDSHLEALNEMKKDEDAYRVLVFPLSRFLFMTVKCDDNSYYIGIPYVKPLILKDCIEGFLSFGTPNYPDLPNIAYKIFDNKDYDVFVKLLNLLNIKYIYSYNKVAPEAAQFFLYKYCYLDKIRSDFYEELDNYSIEKFDDITLFKKDNFLNTHVNGVACALKVDRADWLLPVIYKEDIHSLEDSVIVDIRQ